MLPIWTLFLAASAASGASLWVPTTPQSVQPYALEKGGGIKLAGGNTFPVTGNSSGKAFCILNTNAGGFPGAGAGGGFPHVHRKTYENFYAVKGRVQLWGQNYDSYKANTSVQQTRILGPGDLGAIPYNTIHTFSLLEPDTQLTGVLVPGGFEEFFFQMSFSGGPTGGFDNSALAKFDVYPQPDFAPRHDVVNGRAGPGNWYDGPNPLPNNMSAPIWVAKNYGPRWLNRQQAGRYQIVAPFVTGQQTNGTFSQGTITISPYAGGEGVAKAPVVKSGVATAFMMEEGQLEVKVEGFDAVSLIDGDVVFVPAGVSFAYAATAEFTKFMYVTGGGKGLDAELIAGGETWTSAFYPDAKSSPTALGRMVRI